MVFACLCSGAAAKDILALAAAAAAIAADCARKAQLAQAAGCVQLT